MPNTPSQQAFHSLEPQPQSVHTSFNHAIIVKMTDSEPELSANLGVIAIREADHRLGFSENLCKNLHDPRNQKDTRYRLQELIIERITSMLTGNPTQDACDRQAHDPATRAATWARPGARVADERLASQPTMSRLQDAMATPHNLETLRKSLGDLVARHCFAAGKNRKIKRAALDIDAFPITGYGKQEGLAHNPHYNNEKVFLPLVASLAPHSHYDSTRTGENVVFAKLYGSMPKTAAERLDFIRQALPAAKRCAECVIIRADAEFATKEEMNSLAKDKKYFVMRHKNTDWLEKLGGAWAVRPPWLPPSKAYCQTTDFGFARWHPDWEKSLRVIACVVFEPDKKSGRMELFSRMFFLVTNVPERMMSADAVLEFYRQRGTFEDRLGEWNEVVGANLPARSLVENDVTLQLSLLAFNFANILRGECEAASDPRPDPPANHAEGMGLKRFQDEFLRAVGLLERRGRKLIFRLSRGLGFWWLALWKRFERWVSLSSPVYARRWVGAPGHSFHWFRPRL